jgi:hypothetical protein
MPNPSLDVPQRFSFQHKVDPANAITNENPVIRLLRGDRCAFAADYPAKALILFKDLSAEGTLPICGLWPSVQTDLFREPLRNYVNYFRQLRDATQHGTMPNVR